MKEQTHFEQRPWGDAFLEEELYPVGQLEHVVERYVVQTTEGGRQHANVRRGYAIRVSETCRHHGFGGAYGLGFME